LQGLPHSSNILSAREELEESGIVRRRILPASGVV
jgi:hypothetical protein